MDLVDVGGSGALVGLWIKMRNARDVISHAAQCVESSAMMVYILPDSLNSLTCKGNTLSETRAKPSFNGLSESRAQQTAGEILPGAPSISSAKPSC